MSDKVWYHEGYLQQQLLRDKPSLAAFSGWITEQLNLAFNKGYQVGFGDGESKQAMLELQERDRFIADLRREFEMAGKIS